MRNTTAFLTVLLMSIATFAGTPSYGYTCDDDRRYLCDAGDDAVAAPDQPGPATAPAPSPTPSDEPSDEGSTGPSDHNDS